MTNGDVVQDAVQVALIMFDPAMLLPNEDGWPSLNSPRADGESSPWTVVQPYGMRFSAHTTARKPPSLWLTGRCHFVRTKTQTSSWREYQQPSTRGGRRHENTNTEDYETETDR